MPRGITPQQRDFVRFYLTTAREVATVAARQAGYKAPSEAGSRLRKRLADFIERERLKFSEVKRMGPEDVIRGLEEIAANVEHRDRFNALKTLASILKIDAAPVDRSEIRSQIAEEIQTLRISDSKHPQLQSESKPRLTRTKPD